MAVETQFDRTLDIVDEESMVEQARHLLDSLYAQARMADEKVRALFASMPRQRFLQDFFTLAPAARAEQLLDQAQINSQIVLLKYKWIRRSALALLIAVILWLIAVGLSFTV